MRKNTRVYLVALALFAAGTSFLVYQGLAEGSAYHLDVAEALAMPENELKNVRVFGTVGPEGITRAGDSPGVGFLLLDKQTPGSAMAVSYKGAVPDNFKPGTELYAEGSYSPKTQTFHAASLTTTCPSKYKKENRR